MRVMMKLIKRERKKIDKEMFQCRLLLCDFVFSLSFFSLSFLNQEKCIFVDVKNNARYMRTKRVAHSFAVANAFRYESDSVLFL